MKISIPVKISTLRYIFLLKVNKNWNIFCYTVFVASFLEEKKIKFGLTPFLLLSYHKIEPFADILQALGPFVSSWLNISC